jgi:hypothetical protein
MLWWAMGREERRGDDDDEEDIMKTRMKRSTFFSFSIFFSIWQ